MIAVGGTGSQIARRLSIHHNYFHDLTTTGTVTEMLRFGLTALSLSQGAGVVEHNLLVRCRGENELISNRASGITYRFNTLLDSPTAQFTLRHGNECSVYGNIVRHTEGLRIYGDRHHVHSNYFERNYIGVNLGNGSAEVADGAPLTSHDRPDNCIIAFNTFVENRTHYQMSRRSGDALGATNTTFANNILQGGSIAAKIEGPYSGALWQGNLVWKISGLGDLPADGFINGDPLLAAGDDGILRLQAGSPAIASAVGTFPAVSVDLDGQSRPDKKTRGADEPSEEPRLARLLTPAEVGPHAN
jgi:poly(beta-D-mannuronate) lyase